MDIQVFYYLFIAILRQYPYIQRTEPPTADIHITYTCTHTHTPHKLGIYFNNGISCLHNALYVFVASVHLSNKHTRRKQFQLFSFFSVQYTQRIIILYFISYQHLKLEEPQIYLFAFQLSGQWLYTVLSNTIPVYWYYYCIIVIQQLCTWNFYYENYVYLYTYVGTLSI